MDSIFLDRGFFEFGARGVSPVKTFEDFSRLGTQALTSNLDLLVHDHWYEMRVEEYGDLYEVLYAGVEVPSVNSGLLTDVSRLIDRCGQYSGTNDGSVGVTLASAPLNSDAYPAALDVAAEFVAAIAVSRKFDSGVGEVSQAASGRSRYVFFLSDDKQLIKCVRDHVALGGCSKLLLDRYASRAFPALKLHPDVDPADLCVDMSAHASTVVSHLAFLNDDYIALGSQHGWDLPRMQAAAGPKGVEFSDESANTKKNKKVIRDRSVSFGGKIISCTLHTKVQPTKGRIHFSVERASNESFVYVGIMHEHLPT